MTLRPAATAPTPVPVSAQTPWRGLAACATATAAALAVHALVPMVSPLLVAILLGIAVANLAPLGPRYARGLAIASRPLLRVGVALLGLNLVFGDILGLGAGVIAMVVVVVTASLAGSLWLGRRLGLPPVQRLLIACGTSICGAAAVAAVSAATADESVDEDAATAIGTVVVFGTLLLGLLPLAVFVVGMTPEQGGIWAGAAIHEVAQVVAAGGLIGGGALAVAVVVKLARVLLLAPVIAVIGLQRRRTAPAGRRPPIVPLFVVGFLGCVALASSELVPAPVLAGAGQVQVALLSAAMFALGTGVRIKSLIAVGARPFLLGAAGTAWIAALGLTGALLLA